MNPTPALILTAEFHPAAHNSVRCEARWTLAPRSSSTGIWDACRCGCWKEAPPTAKLEMGWWDCGRMVGQPKAIQKRASRELAGLVTTSRLVES